MNKQSQENVLIGLTGDVMIGRLVENMLSQKEPAYIWGDTLPLFHSTDMNLINLETVLTNSEKEVNKVFNFKAKPERVECLKLASISAVNLANNHCRDYSYDGLNEMLDVLSEANIPYVGAGRDNVEAKRPLILDVKGMKIGIIGFTDNEPFWVARKQNPGTHFIFLGENGKNLLKEEVEKIRDEVDIVILTIHWGPNMRERPTEEFQNFARSAIDSGVDIFHGHSAHLFQGVERYKDKVILYDTGDFVDDYQVDPLLRNDRSFFFAVEVAKNKVIALTLIPVLINRCQVNVSTGEEKEQTIQRMIELSAEFNTELKMIPEGLEMR